MQTQLERSVQLGLLAKDMARVRFQRSPAGKEQARWKLIERMGALHGLPQKIGQILSLGELSQEEKSYTALTEYQATVPGPEALAEIEKQLGRPLKECFRHIEEDGISASLGQVHRAVLHDGRAVAVKFQYPHIAETVQQDLRALGWLTAPVGGLKRGFDLKAYQREVGATVEEELDYRREAQMLRTFSRFTTDWGEVIVPTLVEELSNGRVLTMTWLEGNPLSDARHWPLGQRHQIAETLLRLFLTSCFCWGCLHADPHPGNYRALREDGRVAVGLLDFGCVKQLAPVPMKELLGLIEDVLENKIDRNPDRALARYVGMGFSQDLLEPLAGRLAELSRILFEPFCYRIPCPLESWRLAERVEELLGEYRWNFRFAGPANLLYFMRAYQGLVQYLQALQVPINWRAALDDIRQEHTPASEPDLPAAEKQERTMKSTSLRIRVTENNRTKVEVTFRAHCAENLPDLIPDELEEKLRARSINIHKLARDAVASDFAPGELFTLAEKNKNVRVWLE